MELKLTRQPLRVERLTARGEEMVTIEGEATLPGSMRDAVTVLSVQAQVHIGDTQAGSGEAGVRGRVCFQVLYTQGDLTRIRALETGCDFMHTAPLNGVEPQMRIRACAFVQETEGEAASGRMTLRARLLIGLEAFETLEREAVTDVQDMQKNSGLQIKKQNVAYCIGETLGSGKTLVREEFDLPERLGADGVLSATATASAGECSGGNGKIGVSGVICVNVLHRAKETGQPLVTTTHELPYEMSVEGRLEAGMQPQAEAEVIDVMADSAPAEKGQMLRVEAEVRVTLRLCREQEKELLEDVYSLSGPELEPVREELELHTCEESGDVRESLRLQLPMPKDALPVDTVLAAFAQPVVASAEPAGRRLNVEGIMGVTLIYRPVDSDIPCAVHLREPFAMTFPAEAGEGVWAQAYPIETSPGPATSDRAEIRCVLGLKMIRHGQRRISMITDIAEGEEKKAEHGFVIVWPQEGETRWDTARRLRVAEEALRPAGKRALLAFRK